ncbi:MAG: hypothetical protein LBS94_01620, partial [Prevotellaceae bacterium]|nr:hypothetical protein [Prevotellaceae bacterium]
MAITLQGLNLQMEALTTGTLLGAFESSDAELNDFLFNDAKSYLSALLAVTFLIKSKGEAVAYFCLS